MALPTKESPVPRACRRDDCRLHHITSRGNNRRSIYEDVGDRETFYDLLDKAVERTEVLCHLDVQMGNHYHLLIEGAMGDVSDFVWRLNHRYAVAYNARHGRINHLFGRRFQCIPVPDERGAQAVSVYIALNPVRAGFCAEPGDWPFGSFHVYAGTGVSPRAHLTTTLVSRLFGPGRTLADACAAALAVDAGGRPTLASLLPAARDLTRLHVTQAVRIFGYSYEEIAAHYNVTLRSLFRWLAE
jgi:REP element-mobilizing transposase RayT